MIYCFVNIIQGIKMKILKTVIIILSVLLLGCLEGCKEKTPVVESIPETSVSVSVSAPSVEPVVSEPVSASEDVSVSSYEAMETKTVKFDIVNTCGGNIGMVSILDPVTGEQLDIGALEAGLMVSIEMDWPVDQNVFDIAFYNVLGEFVCSSEVNIEGVESQVTIMIEGDGNIENVKGIVN